MFEFDSHCTAQVSPVCAIVGGIVGQEVVKVQCSYLLYYDCDKESLHVFTHLMMHTYFP